ncbi:peroxidase-like [Battus philenor]|uniref:peroxidase-like n=1 Tax=Battus philenor TaxID=42288 RepID=UPI0035CEDE1E
MRRFIIFSVKILCFSFVNLCYSTPDLTSPSSIDGIASTLLGYKSDIDSSESSKFINCSTRPPACPSTRYRSYDGSCNNLKNPNWGTTKSPYAYLMQNNYPDDVNSWPRASDGGLLPNAREISLNIFIAKKEVEQKWNLNTQQWGQVLAHDLALTADVRVTNHSKPTCCDNNGHLTPDAATHPLCHPILIPEDDPVHTPEGKECMNFVRTSSTKDIGCTGLTEPAIPLSVVTSYMDLSLTYGSDEKQSKSLREGTGGRLWTTVRNGQEWPPQVSDVKQNCEGAQSSTEPCYFLGDSRANQSPQLTALQIILVYEHNRIADELAKLNPHWDDETVFQEARRISIAEIQYINYYEYLPVLLGKKNMIEKKLIYVDVEDYINDYNPDVNPAILVEHSSAAFRHFHTLIRGYLDLIREDRKLAYSVRLSDWFNRPSLLETDNGFDDLVRGLSYQPADKSDEYFDPEITQNLFRGNRSSGEDLRATDIQRGRDHGLAPYVQLRAFFNLSVPKTFKDLRRYMSKENVRKLQSLYKTPKDIDLVVGGSLEKHVPGALVGPTFLNIILQQFLNTRVGDRFFFESGLDEEIAFTLPQLNSIRQGSSMARLLCDNGHNIKWMQRKAFELVSDKNPLVRCTELASVNLALWKEPPK